MPARAKEGKREGSSLCVRSTAKKEGMIKSSPFVIPSKLMGSGQSSTRTAGGVRGETAGHYVPPDGAWPRKIKP